MSTCSATLTTLLAVTSATVMLRSAAACDRFWLVHSLPQWRVLTSQPDSWRPKQTRYLLTPWPVWWRQLQRPAFTKDVWAAHRYGRRTKKAKSHRRLCGAARGRGWFGGIRAPQALAVGPGQTCLYLRNFLVCLPYPLATLCWVGWLSEELCGYSRI
jgi:hypothetical protein